MPSHTSGDMSCGTQGTVSHISEVSVLFHTAAGGRKKLGKSNLFASKKTYEDYL